MAALLVAVYHIWFQRVSGGVDAFFVVAAYFTTTSFLKRDRIDLGSIWSYWARTARRIFPMTAAVILATTAGILIFAPESGWPEHTRDAAASILFVENWRLAVTGTNYLQQGTQASPFRQMWALSLQVQFYLAIPVLLWMAFRAAGRRAAPFRVCGLLLAALAILSFAYNLHITGRNQPWAYFDSFARAWEFLFGALLALLLPQLRTGRPAAGIVGLASLLVFVSFAAFIPVAAAFPGWAATIPVLATAGIFLASLHGAGPAILRQHWVTVLGEIAFAFYLWHWPVLVFARMLLRTDVPGFAEGIGIILISAALAFATTYCLERPFRRWPLLNGRPALALLLSVALMIPPGVGLFGLHAAYAQKRADARAALEKLLRDPGGVLESGSYVPAAVIARRDVPRSYGDGCHQTVWDEAVIECRYGDAAGDRTIVLAGGSHSLQWLPALEKVAAENRYSIVNMTKAACVFSLDDASIPLRDRDSCLAWNRGAVSRIIEIDPDLVVTVGTRAPRGNERIPQGYVDAWTALGRHGITVLALRDNPWPGFDVVDCLESYGATPEDCSRPRAEMLGDIDPTGGTLPDNVLFADFSDLFCDAAICWPVRDNVLVYRDDHHITGTFAIVHSDRLAAAIAAALEKRGPREEERRD